MKHATMAEGSHDYKATTNPCVSASVAKDVQPWDSISEEGSSLSSISKGSTAKTTNAMLLTENQFSIKMYTMTRRPQVSSYYEANGEPLLISTSPIDKLYR